MFARAKQFLHNAFVYESSSHKLAVACALAVYVAFSPFFGFHTLMLIGFGLLFRLNVPLLITIGYAINNPLTMVPVYMAGYAVGYGLLHWWLKIAVGVVNPWWMQSVNNFLRNHLGLTEVSFWAFMVGGNILGIVLAGLCYMLMLPIFRRLARQKPVK